MFAIRALTTLRCRKSVEQHDKRHREIAQLVLAIQQHDEATNVSSPSVNRKRKTRKSDVLNIYKIDDDFDEDDESWADSSDLTSRNDDQAVERLQGDKLKENRNTTKVRKAQKKMATRQARVSVISPDLLKQIDQALHPRDPIRGDNDTEDALANVTIEDNIAFNPRTFRRSALRQSIHEKKLLRNNGTPIGATTPDSGLDEEEMESILQCLHVATIQSSIVNSKSRKTLQASLKEAIQKDVVCVENEDKELMMRMAGYWRYVNRRTYNVMVNNNKLWDWKTGEKLPEMEEDDTEEEDSDAGDLKFSSPKRSQLRAGELEKYDDAYNFEEDADKDLTLIGKSDVHENVQIAQGTRVASQGFTGVKDTRHLHIKALGSATTVVYSPSTASTPSTPTTSKPNSGLASTPKEKNPLTPKSTSGYASVLKENIPPAPKPRPTNYAAALKKNLPPLRRLPPLQTIGEDTASVTSTRSTSSSPPQSPFSAFAPALGKGNNRFAPLSSVLGDARTLKASMPGYGKENANVRAPSTLKVAVRKENVGLKEEEDDGGEWTVVTLRKR